MHAANKQYLPYLLLAVAAIPLFFLNIYDVHAWGDDFSQYIKEAQNIAQGRPYYLSNYVFNPHNPVYAPPQYPPGFPLMLAPMVGHWGLSFTAMCYFNSLLVAILLMVLYWFFRKYTGTAAAICLALALTYSGFMLDMKRNILADIPCLIFSTAYLATRHAGQFSWRRIGALILFAVIAIQIRSQAVFLLGAEALFIVFDVVRALIRKQKLNWRQLAAPGLYIIAGTVVVNLLLDKIILSTPHSTTGFYNNFIKDAVNEGLPRIVYHYAGYVLTTMASFFQYGANAGFLKSAVWAIGIAAVILSLAGFVIKVRNNAEVADMFFVVMVVVILFYPVRDPRYFLPAVPVVYLYCAIALRALLTYITPRHLGTMAMAITAIYLVTGAADLKKAATEIVPGCIPQSKDTQAFNYISNHVKDNELIIFTKPRLLTLFTNKRSINVAWQITFDQNKKIFDSLQAKYMLVVDGLDDGYFKSYLAETKSAIDSEKIAEGYTLYRLQ